MEVMCILPETWLFFFNEKLMWCWCFSEIGKNIVAGICDIAVCQYHSEISDQKSTATQNRRENARTGKFMAIFF